MSSFIKATKRPGTGAFEDAFWVDDMYGPHRYGVVFPDEPGTTGKAFKADDYDFETDERRINPDLTFSDYPKEVTGVER